MGFGELLQRIFGGPQEHVITLEPGEVPEPDNEGVGRPPNAPVVTLRELTYGPGGEPPNYGIGANWQGIKPVKKGKGRG